MPYTQKRSFSSIETDPLRNFKFLVDIFHPKYPELTQMGFMSVSGLNVSTEVIPYREGGMNTTTQKMPGQSDFSPITLSRGLTIGKTGQVMHDWMEDIFAVTQGLQNKGKGDGKANDFRVNLSIKVLEHPVTPGDTGKVKARWKVYNAWPTNISFSDLDAGANALIINQMTLAHEGFDFSLAKTVNGEAPEFKN